MSPPGTTADPSRFPFISEDRDEGPLLVSAQSLPPDVLGPGPAAFHNLPTFGRRHQIHLQSEPRLLEYAFPFRFLKSKLLIYSHYMEFPSLMK